MRASLATNIGPLGRRRRLRTGVAGLAVAVVVAVALTLLGTHRWWRVVVLVPAYWGGLGVVEARHKTGVFLAARGARDMDEGEEQVAHSAERELLRRQAHRVHFRALAIALVVTAAALWA